jgi:hypothetical protein
MHSFTCWIVSRREVLSGAQPGSTAAAGAPSIRQIGLTWELELHHLRAGFGTPHNLIWR